MEVDEDGKSLCGTNHAFGQLCILILGSSAHFSSGSVDLLRGPL